MPGELWFFLLGLGIGGAAMWFAACAVTTTKYSGFGEGPTVQNITARLEREGVLSARTAKGNSPAHRASPR
ncbi:hypothetical protein [Nocardia sp. CC227C]|uniref:hypothetical protein n=1 Tax=Nocardia sp. CC227C TaxID=3044562 RepID=UPI00278C3859|nr:hypothetical protein [Nocardia sp. CC227C]